MFPTASFGAPYRNNTRLGFVFAEGLLACLQGKDLQRGSCSYQIGGGRSLLRLLPTRLDYVENGSTLFA